MDYYKDKALNLVVSLNNATGATFEDEQLAIDIIAETIIKEVSIKVAEAVISVATEIFIVDTVGGSLYYHATESGANNRQKKIKFSSVTKIKLAE